MASSALHIAAGLDLKTTTTTSELSDSSTKESENGFKVGKKKMFENSSKFSVGDKIFHEDFGYGRVINVNGKHLQIVFEKSAIKTLLEDFVQKAA